MSSTKGTMTGSDNPFWKGGRVVDPRGYVLIKQPSHPRADVRGYVYEHVLMAEEVLGRPLLKGEIVRRINPSEPHSPANLKVITPPDVTVRACLCGCGELFLSHDSSRRERFFVQGHNTASAVRLVGRKVKRYGLSTAEYEAKFEEFGGRCAYGCGRSANSLDHVRPRSRGGSDDDLNLVAACKQCNSRKHAHDWLPWVFYGFSAEPEGWCRYIENLAGLLGSNLEWCDGVDEFWDEFDGWASGGSELPMHSGTRGESQVGREGAQP